MFGKLAKVVASCFAASLLEGTNAALTELLHMDDPKEKLIDFDFSVITFFKETD